MSRHHQASLHRDRPIDDDDKRAGQVAREVHGLVQMLCGQAVQSAATNHIHVLLILAQAANSILQLLARASMPDKDDNLPTNSTATLFASLLAYHVGPCEIEKGHLVAEFSPLTIFDALKDVEKLSGQRPDDRLVPNMCKVARECAADPAMIAKIAKERSVLHRGDATLN